MSTQCTVHVHCVHVYVMRKVRIRTILQFRCAKLGLALRAIHQRISLRKARISTMHYTFRCAKARIREDVAPRGYVKV